MIPLVIHTFAAFGLAFVVGFSRISLGFREWVAARSVWGIALLECPACLGYWIGLASGLFDLPGLFGHSFMPVPWLIRIYAAIVLGFYTGATNYALGRLTSLIPSAETDSK